MTTELEIWLKKATRNLATDSAAQVRTEIQEHYESAREAALNASSAPEEADRIALASLGDAKIANRQYRHVLLTATEAKMLRDDNRKARALCASPWLRVFLLSIPAALLLVAFIFFLKGKTEAAKGQLVCAIAIAIWSGTPFLPIYTRWRGRFLRIVKWTILLAPFAIVGFHWPWIYFSCFSCVGTLAWNEWTRASIRRKIPIAQWPKQLYL